MIARSTANMIQTQIAENAELSACQLSCGRESKCAGAIEGYQSPTRQGRYKDRLRRYRFDWIGVGCHNHAARHARGMAFTDSRAN